MTSTGRAQRRSIARGMLWLVLSLAAIVMGFLALLGLVAVLDRPLLFLVLVSACVAGFALVPRLVPANLNLRRAVRAGLLTLILAPMPPSGPCAATAPVWFFLIAYPGRISLVQAACIAAPSFAVLYGLAWLKASRRLRGSGASGADSPA